MEEEKKVNELTKSEDNIFDFKKYTTSDNIFEFEVCNQQFSCQEISTGEEAEFFNYYIMPDGKHNLARLLFVRLTKLVKQPFTKEWIEYIFKKYYPGIDLPEKHEWEDLTLQLRLKFIEKLETGFVGEICKKINKHYSNKEVGVKN